MVRDRRRERRGRLLRLGGLDDDKRRFLTSVTPTGIIHRIGGIR